MIVIVVIASARPLASGGSGACSSSSDSSSSDSRLSDSRRSSNSDSTLSDAGARPLARGVGSASGAGSSASPPGGQAE